MVYLLKKYSDPAFFVAENAEQNSDVGKVYALF